ncbi:MAG TPA: alpha/beta fold hydrolase [bacterium]|jgi:esterase|nr:alpha/beta fold hydrolase [bacterium]
MILYSQAIGQGSPLVCLHGFLGSGDNLWPLADHLKASHRSLLMDLRGHGRSPHGRPYTLDGMADDVAETMGAEGLSKAAVLGHSLGGKVAMALALRHPGLVERLVLADITMAQVPPVFTALLDDMARVPLAGLTRRDEAEPFLRDAEPLLETRRFLLKNLVSTPAGGFQWRLDLEGLREDHPKILAQVPEAAPYLGPTLLIHGKQSAIVGPEGLALTRRFFPTLRVLDLPGGHWIHVDAKDEFNAAVEEFLR